MVAYILPPGTNEMRAGIKNTVDGALNRRAKISEIIPAENEPKKTAVIFDAFDYIL